MSLPAPPPWLASLQDQLGTLLCAPPQVLRGRLQVPEAPKNLLDQIATGKVSSAAQLRIYQEQYWMRFFHVAQEQHPYLLRAIGPWAMNQLAMVSLQTFPPRERELASLFSPFIAALRRTLWRLLVATYSRPLSTGQKTPSLRHLIAALPFNLKLYELQQRCPAHLQEDPWVKAILRLNVPIELFDQALRFDEAVRSAFLAPAPERWVPSDHERATLPQIRLQVSSSLRVLKESWSLLAVGQKELGVPETKRFERYPLPRLWVSWRSPHGPSLLRLSPSAAALLEGSKKTPLQTLGAGLKRRGLPEVSQEELLALVEQGLSRGWWTGPH
ncbi:MAG: hypothetical protein VYD19_08680 [Myxococcota bacterium]|nr:hypothetical protein [Myxococcota bacterium]